MLLLWHRPGVGGVLVRHGGCGLVNNVPLRRGLQNDTIASGGIDNIGRRLLLYVKDGSYGGVRWRLLLLDVIRVRLHLLVWWWWCPE